MNSENANEIIINFSLDAEDQTLNFKMEEESATPMELETGIPIGGVQDYRKLKNLPSINGETLLINYNETDPTVPEWAKGNEPKPLTQTRIEFIWRSIFNE